MALCLCFYKTLYTGHRQSVTRVVARRDARVRDQQHGRAVRGQRPRGEKKVFFGDFLSPDKKLPASRRIAEALSFPEQKKAKSLDSRLRGNDEQR